MTVNPVAGGYYNIGGTYTYVRDMLQKLIALSTVKNIKVETDPERLRPIDADLQVPRIPAKFQAHTGWTPKISPSNKPCRICWIIGAKTSRRASVS